MKNNLRSVVIMLFFGFFVGVFSDDSMIESIAPPGVVFESLALANIYPTKAKPVYRSPIAIIPSHDGTKLFIAEQTARKIAVFDLTTKCIVNRFDLPNEVTGLAISPDGRTLYATCGSDLWPSGMVCVVSIATGQVDRRIPVGNYPRSPVLSPDGGKCYVCNTFDNNISVIDLTSGVEIRRIRGRALREPFAAAISPDGSRLIVGNALSPGKPSDPSAFNVITIIDAKSDTLISYVLLPRSPAVRGVAVSPDGNYAFVTHVVAWNVPDSTKRISGFRHTSNCAVIDIIGQRLVNDVCLDYADEGRADPWGITFTDTTLDNTFMVIAHAGSNNLSIFDYGKFIATVLDNSLPGKCTDLSHRFDMFPGDIRRSVDLQTHGARAIAVVKNTVFTAGYFDDALPRLEGHVINMKSQGADTAAERYSISAPQVQTAGRKGEEMFHDARQGYQRWQSCASCHPFGGADGMGWGNNGIISPPWRTKSLAYSWWTPPAYWTTESSDARTAIIGMIQLEWFIMPTDSLVAPVQEFVKRIMPVPSPYLVKGRLSPEAIRGRALFYNRDKVDCSKCHTPPLFCDGRNYAFWDDPEYHVGMIETPQLCEIWRTASYGHLGTEGDLEKVLSLPGHSMFGKLDVSEQRELIAYVLSL